MDEEIKEVGEMATIEDEEDIAIEEDYTTLEAETIIIDDDSNIQADAEYEQAVEQKELADEAREALSAVLLSVLEKGEINDDDIAEIAAQQEIYTENVTALKILGIETEDEKSTTNVITSNIDYDELIKVLSEKADWLYIDEDGQVMLNGEVVPKIKVMELEAEKIKADVGEFKDLTTENFTAVNAKIDNLEVTDLTAVNADITNLKAQYAEINTLVNGNLTSDNIQSIVITGDKFTVANGFIKDAMIETVSANKINTGTINTNNVSIQSEDGSMVINGTTQQFKDENNVVRIQIGKDATGNFTFCLFSQDGKGILLDADGIKAGAVPDGLIVNNMVADNANISGGKLDISSVISSINGNENTLNSSKIKFDDTNQTLDIAFNQLKSKVETIENVTIGGDLSSVIEQVTTNTTNIGVMQGQISSLISNTTITKQDGTVTQLKDEYNSTKDTVNSHSTKIGSLETNLSTANNNISSVSSKQAALEQNLNGFKQTVSDTYTTKADFNNLNVGGRNLVINSGFKGAVPDTKTVPHWNFWGNVKVYSGQGNTGYNAINTLYLQNSTTTGGGIYQDISSAKIPKNTQITISYDMTREVNVKGSSTSLEFYDASNTRRGSIILGNTTGHIIKTVTTPNYDYSKMRFVVGHEGSNSNGGYLVNISNVKIEKGNKATDWSPAPEDVDNNIAAVDGKFADYSTTTQMNSAITQKANEITSTVSETYATKTTTNNMSSQIKQNADNISTKVDKNGVISSINQSSETISINANKINLNGYVSNDEANWSIDNEGNIRAENLNVEGDLSADTITCNTLNSAKYPGTLDGDIRLFVNSSSGNDDTELEDIAIYETIQGALNALPKFLNGKTVHITMQTNSTEDVYLKGFVGGVVKIYMNGKTLYGTIRTYACSAIIHVYGGTKNDTEGATGIIHPNVGLPFATRSTSVGFESSQYGALYKVKVFAPDTNPSGITSTERVCVASQAGTGSVYCKNVQIVNAIVGFRCNNHGSMHINSSSGIASKYGFQCVTGGMMSLANNSQAGGSTENTNKSSGGQIWYDTNGPTFATGNQSSDTTTAPTVSATKTMTIKSTYGDTYRSSVYNNWKKDGTCRQGDYGYGDCSGLWFFGSAFSELIGKTITKVQITIKRQTGGTSAPVEHKLWMHEHAGRPSGAPTLTSGWSQTFRLATGNSTTVAITNSAVLNAISAGTCKGFALRHTYDSVHYSVCSGSVTVKITYTE